MKSSKRCRVCLVSKKDEPLTSLRDGGKAVFFEKQFGINLTDNNLEALICENCSAKVDEVQALIENTRHLDSIDFSNVNDDDWPQMCCCCRSTSRLKAKSAILLQRITGIDVKDGRKKVLICSKCRKTLKNADLLDSAINENQKEHFSQKISQEVSVKQETRPKKKKVRVDSVSNASGISCDYCNKELSTALKLRRHIENIHKRKKLYCNFCAYSNGIPGNLIEHIANHINPPKSLKKKKRQKCFPKIESSKVSLTCPICTEDLSSVAELKVHFVENHLKNLRLHCDHCGWRCYKKNQMVDHITCKHLIKSNRDMYDQNRQHQCSKISCRKRFKTASLLKQHFNTTHSGIRYTCCWCEKSYCRKTKLNKHQETCMGT